MNYLWRTATFLAAALLIELSAQAQGVQSGVLTGFVRSSDGLSLPGATVSVASPAIQGQRTTATDVNGAYVLRALPPGTYAVTFEFPALAPVAGEALVTVGGTTILDARLQDVVASETVVVAARTPSSISKPTVGVTLQHNDVEKLPHGTHAVARRRARARPHQQHAERQPGHDRRRRRLRQRVPARRRRHRRQPVRAPRRSVRRGSASKRRRS